MTHDNGTYVKAAAVAQDTAKGWYDNGHYVGATFWEQRATNLLLRALLEAINAR